MMTKSLHTVTAVSRVAVLLNQMQPNKAEPATLVGEALRVLGYDDSPATDPVVAACIKATAKLLAKGAA